MQKGTVHLEGISHRFGQQVLFKDLNVRFDEKRITALLGKSGSGKSTLLQVINGLIRPDRGSVFLSGEPLNYAAIHLVRRNIGYAVQQAGLFPHLTAYQNIALPGVITGWEKAKIRDRIALLMQLMGLHPSHKHKYPHELSGGEQQRVGLCRAILLNPPLMLLDEPFSALDVETKTSIYEEVLRFQEQEPRCIILVTHDPREAKTLGDVQLQFQDANLIPAIL